MQAAYLGPPRTATSKDDYSRFYYSHDHFSAPLVSTPTLTRSAPKHKKPNLKKTASGAGWIAPSPTSGPDPTLATKEYGTCLIIGRSGTGKSTLLKNLVGLLPAARQLYLVNVRADEAAVYESLHPGGAKRVSSTSLLQIPQSSPYSTIFIEDIISMREKEQTQLREGINYTAHHKKCKIFCVTHTVYKTGVFSMMPLFHYLIFTSSPANAPVIRQALGLFGLEKEEVKSYGAALVRHTSEWQKTGNSDPRQIYYFLDCTALKLGYSDDNLKAGTARYLADGGGNDGKRKGPEPNGAASTIANDGSGDDDDGKTSVRHPRSPTSSTSLFDCFFSGAKRNAKAHGIYRILANEASVSRHLRQKDLCFVFKSRRASAAVTAISLVDYISLLLHGSRVPTAEQLALHTFIKARCRLPESSIANKHLQTRQQE